MTGVDWVKAAGDPPRRRVPPAHARDARSRSRAGTPDIVLATSSRSRSCAGRLVGAVVGFGPGLVLDLATLRTLGLTSLVLTLAGYWAGRFGEATTRSSPHPPLIAVALATVWVGRRRRRSSSSCSARASRPASSSASVLLPTLALNLLLRTPSTASCAGSSRRSSASGGRCPRLSSVPGFLPPDPRVEEPYRLTPQLAMRIAVLGVDRDRALRGALLAPLGAPGDLGRALPADGAEQPGADVPRRGARAGRSPTATACRSSRTGPRRSCRSGPPRSRGWRRSAAPPCSSGSRRSSNVPVREIREELKAHRDDPLTPVTVSEAVRDEKVALPARAPGGVPRRRDREDELRRYDQGEPRRAAPRLRVRDLARPAREARGARATPPATGSARSGIESAYDRQPARRRPGVSEVNVDAMGRVTSERQFSRFPEPGYSVQADARLRAAGGGRERARVRRRGSRTTTASGPRTAARSSRWTRTTARSSRSRRTPTFDPSVYVGRVRPQALKRLADAGGELPDAQPRGHRALSAGLDVQAGHRARGDPGGAPLARARSSSARARSRSGDDQQVFTQLGSQQERADDADDRARELVRHVLLRRRAARVRAARLADPEVGAADGLRPGDRHRRRPRGRGARPDARLAQAALRERLGPEGLAARRLDPARDRPGRHARDAAPDDPDVRADRERRQASSSRGSSSGSCSPQPRATPRWSSARSRRRSRRTSASTRRRSRPSRRASTTRPTRRTGRRRACSPTSPCRSPARRARPRSS